MQLGRTIQLITKPDGGIIKHLVKLRESRAYRDRTQRCVIQSDLRLLRELVFPVPRAPTGSVDEVRSIEDFEEDSASQHTIPKKIAFYSNGDQDEIQNLVLQMPKTHQFICLTAQNFLKKVTGLQTVDPVNCFVAEVAKPPERPLQLPDEIEQQLAEGRAEKGEDFRPSFRQAAPPSFVVLNRLQDPGNVGNVLRCCVGFGYRHVYFVDGSADPFNEKVLRASRGALLLRDDAKHAVLTYETGPLDRVVQIAEAYNMPLVVSESADANAPPLDSLPRQQVENEKKVIVMNNEASGLSHEEREIFTKANSKFVHIPMSVHCRSLNVASAAAVLLYSLRDNLV